MNKLLRRCVYTPLIFDAAWSARRRLLLTLLKFYREPAVVKVIEGAYREAGLLMSPYDAYALYTLGRMQTNVPGSMAEVGVYRGGSARIICSLKGEKKFYGFDTFEGLPAGEAVDEKWFHRGKYRSDQAAVADYLKPFPGVTLTKGLFPASGSVLDGEWLSFVSLDVDLYRGTLDSLECLWDKMSRHGLILIHDSHCAGVRQAVDEFLADHSALQFGCGCSQLALIRP